MLVQRPEYQRLPGSRTATLFIKAATPGTKPSAFHAPSSTPP
jgi:hypothetical protein